MKVSCFSSFRSQPVDIAPKHAIYGRERRRAVRNAIHTPAYASLNGSSQTIALELCEILNLSESGTCMQAPEPLKVNRQLPSLKPAIAFTLQATWCGQKALERQAFASRR